MSEETTVVLALPLIQPAQAQKHVTHNEALRQLDLIVQLAVESRSLTDPPGAPSEGARFVVPAGATGAWAGQAGRIAVQTQGAWEYLEPREGWQAHVGDEGRMAIFGPAGWVTMAEETHRMAALGISAEADAQNRLSVSSSATLFSHAGGGHQLKVNKAAPVETASLLFQTGFSGRAELGLAGTDAFAVKVSEDGSTWAEALVIPPETGLPRLPLGAAVATGTAALPALHFMSDTATGLHAPATGQIGFSAAGATRMLLGAAQLQVNVPLAGTAVTQSQVDGTAGRIMKVGDFGLGANPPTWPTADLNDTVGVPSGVYYSGSALNRPAGAGWIQQGANGTSNGWQWFYSITLPGQSFFRARSAAGWTAWARNYSAHTSVGTVSQAAGTPTGALIEQGSNANGRYTRWADGTQVCAHLATSVAANAATWTYPAAFSETPRVQATAATTSAAVVATALPAAATAGFRAFDHAGTGVVEQISLLAFGRWF